MTKADNRPVKETLQSETREQLVEEYLRTGYKGENNQHEIMIDGVTYKVLRRGPVTVFYDADGNTLFDVENEWIEKEYEWLMNSSAKPEEGNSDVAEEENTDLAKEEKNSEAGETAEVADSKKDDGRMAKLVAKEKMEKELKEAKDKNFAEPIIGYLLERCEEDVGVAEDVAQDHKTWDKCLDYIYKQAEKQATEMRAVVRYDVVYEWAEDYYHKDDKAEEEKKAKEAAERKKKEAERKKKAAERKKSKEFAKKEGKAEEKPAKASKPKKNPKEIDGQMDLFSMMSV